MFTIDRPGWFSVPALPGIRAVAFSPRSGRVVLGDTDGDVSIWEPQGRTVLAKHDAPVIDVSFDPVGDRVVTSAGNGDAFALALDGSATRRLLKGCHSGAVVSVAFRPPDGKQVVTASNDGIACLWRTDGAGDPIRLRGSGGHLLFAGFSPRGDRLVTTSTGDNAALWSLDLRSALWRATRYCLPPTDRERLLEETREMAAAGFATCTERARSALR